MPYLPYMPYLLHPLHPLHPPQATLLSRDELTGSLVQVRLLAITFEDGQGLMLLAVLANQPAMHYGWSWLCELRAACACCGKHRYRTFQVAQYTFP